MDKTRIEEIIGIAQQWDLDALEVQDEQGTVRVVRRSASPVPAPAAASAPREAAPAQDAPPGLHAVKSPMVGIFLAADPQNGRVLAALGDRVAAGQALGFVEAMKMHTEITADQDGEIVEILAADQQPVQFGAPLFLLKPGGD